MRLSHLNDAEFGLLLSNFAGKIDNYAGRLDVSDPEITSIKNDSAYFNYVLDAQNRVKQFSKDWTAYKNILRSNPKAVNLGDAPVWILPPAPAGTPGTAADISTRFGRLIQRIKGHDNYNEGIGHDLGIIAITGSITPADLAGLKPVLKVHLVAGQPVIEWKKGDADSIEIFKAEGTGEFKFLEMDLYPHYQDKSPLPAAGQSAIWKYRAIYRLGDERVGQWSDDVTVSVMG